ncbi:MAG: YggS family pyridoxal phosphate-dependent enzyme [Candidatus Limnocylindrales bacterium]
MTRSAGTGATAGEARADFLQLYAARRERILGRIAAACERVGRLPGGVALVAVTKTVPIDRVRAAVDAGFTTLGENRVQEAEPKIAALRGGAEAVGSAGDRGAPVAGPKGPGRPVWHLIGPLQSNKAARAVTLFDVVETVDSLRLAARLDRLTAALGGRALPVLVQVNVDDDPAKAGYRPADLAAELPALADLPGLSLLGLMTVGRLVTDPQDARPTFRRLRELSERLRAGEPRLGPELSMGMSDDFEVAVEEGATIVRVGRAIFGERPAP